MGTSVSSNFVKMQNLRKRRNDEEKDIEQMFGILCRNRDIK